jgi:HPt (histidine-containing phosphotransfer) domain-containing protein
VVILAVANRLVNHLVSRAVADVLDPRVLDDLRASVGGDEAFVSELIGELLDDAPRQLDALRAALDAGDGEAARRAAHTLKGHGRTFGATELSSLSQEAEAAAAGGDLDAVKDRLDAVAEAWERVRIALVAVRDGPA